MPLETCENCGRKFYIWQDSAEKLLNAIFGRPPLCKKCTLEADYPKCAKCGKVTTSGLAFNDNPYCPECLPYSE